MTHAIRQEGNQWKVSGDLLFANILAVRTEGDALIEKNDDLHFDFSEVSQVDSSALSLLLAWLRKANTHQKKIQFENIPASLQSIAKACDLSELLSLT